MSTPEQTRRNRPPFFKRRLSRKGMEASGHSGQICECAPALRLRGEKVDVQTIAEPVHAFGDAYTQFRGGKYAVLHLTWNGLHDFKIPCSSINRQRDGVRFKCADPVSIDSASPTISSLLSMPSQPVQPNHSTLEQVTNPHGGYHIEHESPKFFQAQTGI